MSEASRTYRKSIFRSLTLAMTLGPALIFAVITAWSVWLTQMALRDELINQVNDDIASLAEIHLDDGPDAVVKAIEQRLTLSPLQRADAYYLFGQAEDGALAGNLPETLLINPDLTKRLDTIVGDDVRVIGRVTLFRNGDLLIVTRDADMMKRNIWFMWARFLIGLLVMLILSYGFTKYFAGQLRRRVDRMNVVMGRVVDGHLDARIASSHAAGDELDEIGFLGYQIDRVIARAERLLDLRKRVTDEIAHEIRSPLIRLNESLDAIETETGEPPALSEARDKIKKCVQLLDGLLDMSSINAQEGDSRGYRHLDLRALLGSVVELYDPVAEESGRRILDLSRCEVWIDGDSSQIGRLVSNLLDNAIKYSSPGSDIIVDATQSEGMAVLRVRNEGPRLLGQVAKDVFIPFYRHPDIVDRGGHGLGLALCRSIALRHGGTLIVECDPQLTIFRFDMPLARGDKFGF